MLLRTRQLAAELAGKSATALAHIKRLVRGVGIGGSEAGFAAERTLFCVLMVSPDGIARMEAMHSGRVDLRDSHAVPLRNKP